MTGRIGFCCKWLDDPSETSNMKVNARNRELNTGTTTVAWLNRQPLAEAEKRIHDLAISNISAVGRMIERVGRLVPDLRMCRIGSDILPVFTEPTWSRYYRDSGILQDCEREFARIGQLARDLDVRLSFHPGQFCVLASDDPGIVDRSVEEFEYHATMARMMGYGRRFQDFKINVHISGRRGPQGILDVLGRLTPEARNCITIENEEISHGLDACLTLADHLPIVLDVHHHWVHSGGYLDPFDPRVDRVVGSWRGVRPVMHYSVSREDVLVGHDTDAMPDMAALLAAGHKKQKLRAHSDFYWNRAVNDYALGFSDRFDIQCESKAKNLASAALHAYHASRVALQRTAA